MKGHEAKIVADGPQRWRDAKDYGAVRRRVVAEVAPRYEVEKKKASIWRRLWLEVTPLYINRS
jgi:hypothetical protein